MAYADITVNDRNPVKRWLQRRRFSDALRVLESVAPECSPWLLDFGAGDGELSFLLTGAIPAANVCVYEPTPSLLAEARTKLTSRERVCFADRLETLPAGRFDYVFCLEVFEHLPEQETDEAISAIARFVKPGGRVVVGVPVEIFLPAVFKGLFRMSRRLGDFDANPKNVIAAALGRPPAPRPVDDIAPRVRYHFHHLGFDFRVLERQFARHFSVVRRWFSPFPLLGAMLNSEVYFLLSRTVNHDRT